MSMHGQRGIVGRVRDLVNGVFAVWMREREAERPDAVYERVIGERVRQYAELKRAVAGILYMRNKIEGELRERRASSPPARGHRPRSARMTTRSRSVLITGRTGCCGPRARAARARRRSPQCEGAKANLVRFRAEIRTWSAKLRMLAQLANARPPAHPVRLSRASLDRRRDEALRACARSSA
jgi:hypothetical protein